MKIKELWNKFLVTLGYIAIAILTSAAGFIYLRRRKRKITDEDIKPGDIIDSLPNSDAVRERINDFGTSTGDSGRRKSNDASAGGGLHDKRAGSGNPGVLAGWVDRSKRMDIPGTSKVMRIRNSGSPAGPDDTD